MNDAGSRICRGDRAMALPNGWIVQRANLLRSALADSRCQCTKSGSVFLRARIGDDDPRLLFEVVAAASEQQCFACELFGLRGLPSFR